MYEKSNNCMVMWFDGKNLNEKVMFDMIGVVVISY